MSGRFRAAGPKLSLPSDIPLNSTPPTKPDEAPPPRPEPLTRTESSESISRRRERPKPILNPMGADFSAFQSAVAERERQIQAEQSAQDSLVEMAESMKTLIEIKDSDLETLEELGMGSGGTVYRVRHIQTGQIMAKKIIHQIDAKTSKEIVRELQILNKCQSPYIITFFGAYAMPGELCVCMEYMDVGSLEIIGKVSGPMEEPVLAKITLAVLRGLAYLYEKHRIVHRDIKPSNILVNSKGRICLCDFGVSGIITATSADTFVGTGAYMSPERIQGGKYSTQGDTWSLGLTLLELALGRYPFGSGEDSSESINQLSVFELLQHIIGDPIPQLPADKFSGEFRQLVNDMMIRDPKLRPTPAKLLAEYAYMPMAERLKFEVVAWARSFAKPNMNEQQKQRWSVSQQQKRMSVAEKRKSKGIWLADGVTGGVNGLKLSD